MPDMKSKFLMGVLNMLDIHKNELFVRTIFNYQLYTKHYSCDLHLLRHKYFG